MHAGESLWDGRRAVEGSLGPEQRFSSSSSLPAPFTWCFLRLPAEQGLQLPHCATGIPTFFGNRHLRAIISQQTKRLPGIYCRCYRLCTSLSKAWASFINSALWVCYKHSPLGGQLTQTVTVLFLPSDAGRRAEDYLLQSCQMSTDLGRCHSPSKHLPQAEGAPQLVLFALCLCS